jgi:hypothetical protein
MALSAQTQQQDNLSLSQRESQYFPGLNANPAGKQLESLRSVERRLTEMEKKLDRLIQTMERIEKNAAQ